ncbi:flagellar assembly peptidoglycan hydrolase FlgJ [Pseudoxanthomonas broegbernensis]|uniref:Peptidoglycan hydrolase FlgJ n=1 Tax=Pseudoxanthomonas broegbernensis TaxID=83619 RepID=A0A7V8GL63_9GAMM|nr:flagellar assembly peptidoglycan hydrolase FlgJ [Pseudoxanthomonas broegbernensis]KAF1685586.1 flagellar assembly peptidoglycan hydrolase FlgJ [Pseudoxanthomonas broegbernensis]MBB6065958.1 flagellar protein FlgJ [Pseudoxanthomonas broegbernensis]
MRIGEPLPMDLAAAPQKADPARIDHVARQLEGQFAQMLVKSMRDASFGDSLFPGENQTFRDLYDQRLAKALTEGKGLGLAPMIARQLSRQSGVAEAAAPALDTRLPASVDGRAGPTRAAAAALAYARARGGPADGMDGLAGLDRALDLIAGRGDGEGTGASASPLDALVQRLMAGVDGAVASPTARAAATAEAGFAPHSPERFVAGIWHHAQSAARELGVDARALVAQAALETGWGRRQIQRQGGDSAHNLFGIKAAGWKGERATAGTHEYVDGVRVSEKAEFRAYASPAESFADYVRMLKNNPRYRQALQSGGDVKRFAQALQNAGYATDPSYAAKITAIANGPTIGRAVQAIAGVAARTGADLAAGAGAAVASAAGALGAANRR